MLFRERFCRWLPLPLLLWSTVGPLSLSLPTTTAHGQSLEEARGLMENPEPGVVDEGIQLLAELGTPEASAALLQRIRRGLPAPQLQQAIEALAKLGHSEAEGTLVSLTTHRRGYIRAAACKALGELKAESAYQALARRLGDSEAPVREAAARALGALGRISALPILVEAMDKGNRAAAVAVGELIPTTDPDKLFSYFATVPLHRLEPALAQALVREDTPSTVKVALIKRIGSLPDQGGDLFLKGFYDQHSNNMAPEVRDALRNALRRSRNQ